ncbi:ABC transporter permease [Nitriliruptor alkaliphilus]|uniref:ABC transporter permease n=1 Tax=Nitriliruptor alkaliphilus TaxID=427918 RepID=UPI00069767B6|nr:ABC transporter permease [Nitriliruptor alkaliphilus]
MLASIASTVTLLLLASVLIFVLVRSSPGDPIDIQFGESGASAYLTPEQEEELREDLRRQLGLDGSLGEQYGRWLALVVRGDLGTSFRSGRPVVDELGERLPATLMLGGAGFVVALVLGTALAVTASRRADGVVDHGLRVFTLTSISLPTFLSGSLALAVAANQLGYEVAGPARLGKVWLPALVLGLSGAPTFSRVLRASLLAERSQLYAHAARIRGASESHVIARHTLRPALSPVLTLAGLALASLLGGAVITEAIFSWPGVAAYAVGAIRAQDYPVVQGYILLMTLVVVLVNRAIDLTQRVVDPRTRVVGVAG